MHRGMDAGGGGPKQHPLRQTLIVTVLSRPIPAESRAGHRAGQRERLDLKAFMAGTQLTHREF